MGIKKKFTPLALSNNKNKKKSDHFHQGKQHNLLTKTEYHFYFLHTRQLGDDACDMYREAEGTGFS